MMELSSMEQMAFNVALCVAGAVLSFMFKSLSNALKDLREADKNLAVKINNMEVVIAGEYLKRDEFKQFTDAVFKKLDRIEERVSESVSESYLPQKVQAYCPSMQKDKE